jgi:2,4-dienoyl-CoA reductase-like NADH-dependent reductase (Old Yellow Enzyme family)
MDNLFSQLSIANVALRNRFAVAPMTRTSATSDGKATSEMRNYYSRFARGQFALVITEGTYIDTSFSQGYANQPGIATSEQANAWAALVRDVHQAGARIFIQLMHAGALSQHNHYREGTVGPSAVRPKGEQMGLYGGNGPYQVPRALTKYEIAEIVQSFSSAGKRALDAGFDGIEIHGANGYLLDQFLTDYTNQRQDEYGGGIENRVRLAAQIVSMTKDALRSAAPVGIRLSQTKVNDYTYQWPGGEKDAKAIFHFLSEAGADFVHVTSKQAWQPAFDGSPSLPELAKRFSNLPVIANGSLHDPQRAAQMVSLGASMISLGRGALATPDCPERLRQQQSLEEFDPAMLRPTATLANEERWRQSGSALPAHCT